MSPDVAIAKWQPRLRLGDWVIRLADGVEPDEGDRSSIDMHANIRQAAIMLRSDTPAGQVERQVVHELLHARLVIMEQAFREAKEWTPRSVDHALDAMWALGAEGAIEALCDALGLAARGDWGPSDKSFQAAFPS